MDNGLLFILAKKGKCEKHSTTIRNNYCINWISFIEAFLCCFLEVKEHWLERILTLPKSFFSVWLKQLPDENHIHIFKIEYCYIYVYRLCMLINPADAQKNRKQINYCCFFLVGVDLYCFPSNRKERKKEKANSSVWTNRKWCND